MATSAKTPMWKRLVVIVAAIAVGVAVPFAVKMAGAPWLWAYAAGVVAALVTLLVVAALLRVRLKRGWE